MRILEQSGDRAEVHDVQSFHLSLYTACQSILLCVFTVREVQGLLLEEDLCSHIDTGELELHKFAVICKEVLRS